MKEAGIDPASKAITLQFRTENRFALFLELL
jgi:hypothetical protein